MAGAVFFAPGSERELPVQDASDGILHSLMLLTAAAGGDEGGLVLFDEPENGLHPAAIRSFIEALRGLSEERGVNFVLATHSPVVLNAFSETPEDVWVAERREGKEGGEFPSRLSDLYDPEWLANYRLGNLYGAGFARQGPLGGAEG
jgi:predicted ATPase